MGESRTSHGSAAAGARAALLGRRSLLAACRNKLMCRRIKARSSLGWGGGGGGLHGGRVTAAAGCQHREAGRQVGWQLSARRAGHGVNKHHATPPLTLAAAAAGEGAARAPAAPGWKGLAPALRCLRVPWPAALGERWNGAGPEGAWNGAGPEGAWICRDREGGEGRGLASVSRTSERGSLQVDARVQQARKQGQLVSGSRALRQTRGTALTLAELGASPRALLQLLLLLLRDGSSL